MSLVAPRQHKEFYQTGSLFLNDIEHNMKQAISN